MLNVRSSNIIGCKDMKVPYEIISKTDQPKGLAILIPGMGYTSQAPVFHYSTGVFLNKDYDVLHVNYQYSDEKYDLFSYEELVEFIHLDVSSVLDEVLKDSAYDSFYIVGKSFGTLAMGKALERELLQNAKAIWLTPLITKEEVFEPMKNSLHKGLCVIGDKDRFYKEDLINELGQNENIEYIVLPDVNHSLEYDHHVVDSIDVIKTVIEKINNF